MALAGGARYPPQLVFSQTPRRKGRLHSRSPPLAGLRVLDRHSLPIIPPEHPLRRTPSGAYPESDVSRAMDKEGDRSIASIPPTLLH